MRDRSKESTIEIIKSQSFGIMELKKRKVIRSNNFIGDVGEWYAVNYYNATPELPNIKVVDVGTKYIDAIDTNNDRYSIKTITGSRTGIFRGLNEKGNLQPQKQLFEYVLIVVLNDDYTFSKIYELDWESFLELKIWDKRNRAWYLTISKNLEGKSIILYE